MHVLCQQLVFIESDMVIGFATLRDVVARDLRIVMRMLHRHGLGQRFSNGALRTSLDYRSLGTHGFQMPGLDLHLSLLYLLNGSVPELPEPGALVVLHNHGEFMQPLLRALKAISNFTYVVLPGILGVLRV